MNSVEEAIRERRSIRRYQTRSLDNTTIDRLLEAARWAPSAHNRQPWRFAVIIDSEIKAALARAMGSKLEEDLNNDGVPPAMVQKDVARSFRRLTSAPVLIVISMTMEEMDHYPDERRSKIERLMAIQSTAMAGQNLMVTAHSLGLATCWMCAPLFCPETVRGVLGLPASWEPQGIITAGYPAEERTRSRKPLAEVLLHESGSPQTDPALFDKA